jgi:hypothetical protein
MSHNAFGEDGIALNNINHQRGIHRTLSSQDARAKDFLAEMN